MCVHLCVCVQQAKTKEQYESRAHFSSKHMTSRLSDKPLAKNLEKKCDNPYHHVETAAEACRFVHSHCPQVCQLYVSFDTHEAFLDTH